MFFFFIFSLFSSAKAENRRGEQVLPRGQGWHLWEGAGAGKVGRRMNTV
jgi:hypothetical protein